jgi:phosphorylase kinase alpha/beta subunit
MMRQAHKVEQFKQSLAPHRCPPRQIQHRDGEPVVGDYAWGHLQIDATSLYLLMLAQMIASGLDIIWTLDEVNFIQNLVYYIEHLPDS